MGRPSDVRRVVRRMYAEHAKSHYDHPSGVVDRPVDVLISECKASM